SELGGRMASASPLKIALAALMAVVALGFLGSLAKRAGAAGGAETARYADPGITGDFDDVLGKLPGAVAPSPNIASLKALGALFLDPKGFLIPFELISVLLLAAMVGAIAVARDEGRAP
ncbi:MAG: NADH-quinone oxidoreductase subunit J, partial [Fibrobacteria bacterium]